MSAQPSAAAYGEPEARPQLIVSPETKTAKRPSTVDLPLPLADWAKDASRSKGIGIGDFVILAMEATAHIWPAQIAKLTIGGNLFPARVIKTTPERTEPTRAVSLRLTTEEAEILAELVTKYGAASRTQVIIAALQAYQEQQEGA
jgi:hypothetical protein